MTEFLEVADGKIAYDVTGSGPLVVLSHGIGDRRQAYRFLAPRLAQAGYRVASADLRGHGESSMGRKSVTGTDDAITHPDIAGDLIALIRHLGGPAVIVGHSISGGAATIAAVQEPEPGQRHRRDQPVHQEAEPEPGRLPADQAIPAGPDPADRAPADQAPGPVAALPRCGLPGQARRLRRLHGRAGRQAARTRPDGGVHEDRQVQASRDRHPAARRHGARPWSSWARSTPTSPIPGPRATPSPRPCPPVPARSP